MGSNALHVLALGECPSPQMFGFSKKKKTSVATQLRGHLIDHS